MRWLIKDHKRSRIYPPCVKKVKISSKIFVSEAIWNPPLSIFFQNVPYGRVKYAIISYIYSRKSLSFIFGHYFLDEFLLVNSEKLLIIMLETKSEIKLRQFKIMFMSVLLQKIIYFLFLRIDSTNFICWKSFWGRICSQFSDGHLLGVTSNVEDFEQILWSAKNRIQEGYIQGFVKGGKLRLNLDFLADWRSDLACCGSTKKFSPCRK